MLTGRYRFARSFFGGVRLEVEDRYEAMWPGARQVRYGTEWRKATLLDLTDAALRGLTQPCDDFDRRVIAAIERADSEGILKLPRSSMLLRDAASSAAARHLRWHQRQSGA